MTEQPDHLQPKGVRPIGFVPAPFDCDWLGHHFVEGEMMLFEHFEAVMMLSHMFED